VYSVHDWAEVHRLHHVEGMAKAAIAAKLAMSRTTVHRLLAYGCCQVASTRSIAGLTCLRATARGTPAISSSS
jgi:hypothetical protein